MRELQCMLLRVMVMHLHQTARARYGFMWYFMANKFLTMADDGQTSPYLVLRLALVACEQVRKMAEVAADAPWEDRYASR